MSGINWSSPASIDAVVSYASSLMHDSFLCVCISGIKKGVAVDPHMLRKFVVSTISTMLLVPHVQLVKNSFSEDTAVTVDTKYSNELQKLTHFFVGRLYCSENVVQLELCNESTYLQSVPY